MLDPDSMVVMQIFSSEIRKFSDNIGPYLPELMPLLEMNALSQVCSNQQLSEEVRNMSAARLEAVITRMYGEKYGNDRAKQFK